MLLILGLYLALRRLVVNINWILPSFLIPHAEFVHWSCSLILHHSKSSKNAFYFLMIKLFFPFWVVWEARLISAGLWGMLSSSRRRQERPGSKHKEASLCNAKFLLLQDLSILILQLSQQCHVLFASCLSYKIVIFSSKVTSLKKK